MMAGKVLTSPNRTHEIDYQKMAHMYDNLPEASLENMRLQAESRMREANGRELARNVFQQSVSSKILNQQYGTSYPSAGFDDEGRVIMEEPKIEAQTYERPLPTIAQEESIDFNDDFTF